MTSHAIKKTTHVQIKRAYDPSDSNDGYRVLVDRLWPRGIAKEDLKFDEWNKDLAPSPALRTWFGHKVENWERFNDSYRAELHTPEQKQRMQDLISAAKGRPITLVYGAKDVKHNHAVILASEINSLY